MTQYLKYILPAYLLVYFLFLLVIRMVTVGRQIGKNPIILTVTDDAHGIIALYFKGWMILLVIYAVIYALWPSVYVYFMPMGYLESDVLKTIGVIILAISLVWTYISQAQMRESWRVGIDQEQKTELVTRGIFRFSRNPIYVGMMASMIGLLLVTPNAFTLLLGAMGIMLIQIQVRLEEEFLQKMHGQDYLDYKGSVRRFI